jgi:uncharacterized pyridoxamine 5'-phosphate oxidase family protein
MTERRPDSAENIANQYDDDVMQESNPDLVIPWDVASERLAESQTYWWATTRPDGQAQIRPVLAVLIDGVLYSTTNRKARKARNLQANPQVAFSTSTDEIDFVVEGRAAPVSDLPTLERIAKAYRAKYGWPVTLRDGAFHAPFGAPTAGPPPYQPYSLVPDLILGLGTTERYAMHSTRWRFRLSG